MSEISVTVTERKTVQCEDVEIEYTMSELREIFDDNSLVGQLMNLVDNLTAQLADAEQALKEKTAECERLNNRNFLIADELERKDTQIDNYKAECEELRAANKILAEQGRLFSMGREDGYRAGMERAMEIAELFSGNNGTGDRVANAIRAEMENK